MLDMASPGENGQAVNVEFTGFSADLLARKDDLKTKINIFLFEDKSSLSDDDMLPSKSLHKSTETDEIVDFFKKFDMSVHCVDVEYKRRSNLGLRLLKAGWLLRSEINGFLVKSKELIADADVVLSQDQSGANSNLSALQNQNHSLKSLAYDLKKHIQLMTFRMVCDCKELQREQELVSHIEEIPRNEIIDLILKAKNLLSDANSVLVSDDTKLKNITSLQERNNFLKQLISKSKECIPLMLFRIVWHFQELHKTIHDPEKIQEKVLRQLKIDKLIDPKAVAEIQNAIDDLKKSQEAVFKKLELKVVSDNSGDDKRAAEEADIKGIKDIENRVNQLQEELDVRQEMIQKLKISFRKNPLLLSSHLVNLEMMRSKRIRDELNELARKMTQLKDERFRSSVFGVNTQSDEWKCICNEFNLEWGSSWEEYVRKQLLEATLNDPEYLQRQLMFYCKMNEGKTKEFREISRNIARIDELIDNKKQQLSVAVTLLENECIAKWHRIEQEQAVIAPVPNFKKYIQLYIVDEGINLCWPEKADYRDKYAITIGHELVKDLKETEHTENQIFEFWVGIRDFILNSSAVSSIVDIALEIDRLEIENREKAKKLKSCEETIENYTRDAVAVIKILSQEIHILNDDNKPLDDQVTVREKIKQYFALGDKGDKDLDFIDNFFAKYYSPGFSILWLYNKWEQNVTMGFSKENYISDAKDNWLNSTIQSIKEWTPDRMLLLLEGKEDVEFNSLISQIQYFGSVYNNNNQLLTESELSKLTDKDSKYVNLKYIENIKNKELLIDSSIASLFTLSQFKQVLKKILLDNLQNNKLILVDSYNSTTALFKDGTNYYYFDPNGKFEEIRTTSIDALANLIFITNCYVVNKPSPLGLRILSFVKKRRAERQKIEEQKTLLSSHQKYLLLKKLLDSINPILTPEKNYAHEISGLIMAAKIGSLESVQYFLDKGVGPNTKDTDGFTALIYAVYYNHSEVVKLLLKQKSIDPNIKTRNGEFALSVATKLGYLEVIKELLACPNT